MTRDGIDRIVVNGRERDRGDVRTVLQLVRSLGLDPARVAVERNREIAPRALHAEIPVEPGDVFEMVQLVGGG